jgi:hypothetical protein
MQRNLILCLLSIAGLFAILPTSYSGEAHFGEGVYTASAIEAVSPSLRSVGQVTSRRQSGQRRKRQDSQPSKAEEKVNILPKVQMENIDSEIRQLDKAPSIVLTRGQKYKVEQRYTNVNYATLHGVFDAWKPTNGHPDGFWVFQRQDFLDWSHRSGDNQGEGVLIADNYPSGKCLITFWSHSEAVNADSRYRPVPFTKWTPSTRNIQGKNITVFTFEFRDKYTTATVTLYRLP